MQMLSASPAPIRIRKGTPITIPFLIDIIQEAGHPTVLAIPAWAWTIISMAIRLDQTVRPEGEDPYFYMGVTKVVPNVPPDRLHRIDIEDYESDIITPDQLRN